MGDIMREEGRRQEESRGREMKDRVPLFLVDIFISVVMKMLLKSSKKINKCFFFNLCINL